MDAMSIDVEQSRVQQESNDGRGRAAEPAGLAGVLGDDSFVPRHIGPSEDDVRAMLATLGLGTLEELVERTVPASIRLKKPLHLGAPRSEWDVLTELREIAEKNQVVRSFIG